MKRRPCRPMRVRLMVQLFVIYALLLLGLAMLASCVQPLPEPFVPGAQVLPPPGCIEGRLRDVDC